MRVSGKGPRSASSALIEARPSTPWPSTVSASTTKIPDVAPVTIATLASGHLRKSALISSGSVVLPHLAPLCSCDLCDFFCPGGAGNTSQPIAAYSRAAAPRALKGRALSGTPRHAAEVVVFTIAFTLSHDSLAAPRLMFALAHLGELFLMSRAILGNA